MTLSGWTHLALVRDNGIATFYVNGVSAGTSANTPVTPTGGFTIDAYTSTGSDFDGLIDEVRLFTFSPDQFSTSDLLLNAPFRPPVVVTDPATLIFTNGIFRSFSGASVRISQFAFVGADESRRARAMRWRKGGRERGRHRAARQEPLREVAGAAFGFSFFGFLISFF